MRPITLRVSVAKGRVVGQPNALLRAARETTASSVAPGEGMTRRELAEAVNAYLWRTNRQRYDLDAHQIARWERGNVRWPSTTYRSALRAVLDVASDADLGFSPRRQPVELRIRESCEPPPPVSDDSALVSPPPDSIAELAEWLDKALAVDPAMIDLLDSQTDYLRTMDRNFGAVTLSEQMRGHIRTLVRLVSHSVRNTTRSSLARVLADAAALAGWQALDRGQIAQAWQHHESAKTAATEAGSPALLAHAMAEQSFDLIDLGRPADAIALVEHARFVAGTAVPPLLVAWLWAAEGEVHAAARESAMCRRAFEAAIHALPTDTHDPTVPYISLNSGHLARWYGNALARLGDAEAIEHLYAALERTDPTVSHRARAALHTDLAYALTASGDHDQAGVQISKARMLATRVGSARQWRRIELLVAAR